MSNYTIPVDKFYLRDLQTGQPIEWWAPYSGIADYAQFANAPTGTLAATITQINNNITGISDRLGPLETDVAACKGQISGINTNIQENMNKYLEGYNKIHTQGLSTSEWESTLSAGLYELRLNCDDFSARLVFLYDEVESLELNQVVFSTVTNMWYAITLDIFVGSQTPPISNSFINVTVEAFDYPGNYIDYTDGDWELYRLASIK